MNCAFRMKFFMVFVLEGKYTIIPREEKTDSNQQLSRIRGVGHPGGKQL